MPRNGSGVYGKPFPDVEEGTTIESAVYNGFVGDVEQDLNTKRPITSGGTGADNARDAMLALGGEIAKQGPVDNYAAFPFVSGSFFSNVGATDSPEGAGAATAAYTGICYAKDVDNFFIEARNLTTGQSYVRGKIAGSWGTWAELANTIGNTNARYVKLAGDTMTGALTLDNSNIDGAELYLASQGFGTWAIDNYSGMLRCHQGGVTGWQVSNGAGTVAVTGALTVGGSLKVSGNNTLIVPAPTDGTQVNPPIGYLRFRQYGLGLALDYTGTDGVTRSVPLPFQF
jgi:hypothetical protein